MTARINYGISSATNKNWLEVTKGQSISELIPHNTTAEPATINEDAFTREGALKKASAKVEVSHVRSKKR